MKIGSDANCNVRVQERGWDESPQPRPLFEGMCTFDLNQVVEVSFVPRVSAAGPPWSVDGLPEDIDDFTTVEQTRVSEVLTSAYAVTPDDARAGTVERLTWPFPWPPDSEFALPTDEQPTPTVFFVTTDEFDRLAADLAALSGLAGNVHSTVRHDVIADHEAVRFIDNHILGSPWLKANHAMFVGRAG